MQKIALTAAALLFASGMAFASSDHYDSDHSHDSGHAHSMAGSSAPVYPSYPYPVGHKVSTKNITIGAGPSTTQVTSTFDFTAPGYGQGIWGNR